MRYENNINVHTKNHRNIIGFCLTISSIILMGTVLTFFLIIGCSSKDSRDNESEFNLSKEEILKITYEFVKSREFFHDNMRIHYDEDNKKWGNLLSELKISHPDIYQDCNKVIKKRKYQAIHFNSGPNVIDGSFWVMIDKESGEVFQVFVGL